MALARATAMHAIGCVTKLKRLLLPSPNWRGPIGEACEAGSLKVRHYPSYQTHLPKPSLMVGVSEEEIERLGREVYPPKPKR